MKHRLISWFSLEGSTGRERIRNNPLQLIVLVFGMWFIAIGVYFSLVPVIGELLTAVVMLLGALVIGLRLRRALVQTRATD